MQIANSTQAAEVIREMSGAFPPSYLGSGIFFAFVLSSMLASISISASTILRLNRLTRDAGDAMDSPNASSRRIIATFLWGFIFLLAPFVVAQLIWNDPMVPSWVQLYVDVWGKAALGLVLFFILAAVNHGAFTYLVRRVTGRTGNLIILDPRANVMLAEAFSDFGRAIPDPMTRYRITTICTVLGSSAGIIKTFLMG